MFSNSYLPPLLLALGVAGCAGTRPDPGPEPIAAPGVFYTVTGEIAAERNDPRVAALQYAAAATAGSDLSLLAHASEVTQRSLQPSLTEKVAQRWIALDPSAVEAHRALARAALELDQVARAAEQYRIVIETSSRGPDVELADLEVEFAQSENVYGARQTADRLAEAFPSSQPALRLAGFAAMRADDPKAAARRFAAALAARAPAAAAPRAVGESRRDLVMAYWRARILSGDVQVPLAEALALAEADPTPSNILDHALLLLAAQKNDAAISELETLAVQPEVAPVALRLLGLVEFQEGRLDKAAARFTEALSTGKVNDDAVYYLGLIAERLGDAPRAMRFYGEVQGGDNAVAARLRAAGLLQAHGEARAAQALLERLALDEPARAPAVFAARAKLYSDAGDGKRAIEMLERGMQQYPDSVDIRYALASTYEEQGQLKHSLEELKAVLESRPDDPAAMNAYGYTLADHDRDLKRARRLIERACAQAPHDAAILDSLGWVLYRQGRTAEALTYLQSAYADDRGADIGAHLGEVLWRLGRHEEADKVWNEAGAEDARNKLLDSTRQRLHASAP